jgi:hypothetical protein
MGTGSVCLGIYTHRYTFYFHWHVHWVEEIVVIEELLLFSEVFLCAGLVDGQTFEFNTTWWQQQVDQRSGCAAASQWLSIWNPEALRLWLILKLHLRSAVSSLGTILSSWSNWLDFFMQFDTLYLLCILVLFVCCFPKMGSHYVAWANLKLLGSSSSPASISRSWTTGLHLTLTHFRLLKAHQINT